MHVTLIISHETGHSISWGYPLCAHEELAEVIKAWAGKMVNGEISAELRQHTRECLGGSEGGYADPYNFLFKDVTSRY
jgi:hypothetical protein